MGEQLTPQLVDDVITISVVVSNYCSNNEYDAWLRIKKALRADTERIKALEGALEKIAAITYSSPEDRALMRQYQIGYDDGRGGVADIARAALTPTPERPA